MVAGQSGFSDFVSMDQVSMSAALGGLSVASTAVIVTVMQGNTVSFGYKYPNT